ncbi:MAG: hypothetical protein HYV27_02520 [Candidatus Hydrogenedentes bacterium]|nr:hypothetical protein [Candidatus Hydrogenedentota bacterium]
MVRHKHGKLERIVEAVRLGIEGEDAVHFIHSAGFAMTSRGIARQLQAMQGRAHVESLIAQGKSNVEILESCFPQEAFEEQRRIPPQQEDLFGEPRGAANPVLLTMTKPEAFESTKMTLRLPTDLYEAIRLAAKAEDKSQGQLIIDILTSALSRMPEGLRDEEEDAR